MVAWLPGGEHNLPQPCTHYVGVGVAVVDAQVSSAFRSAEVPKCLTVCLRAFFCLPALTRGPSPRTRRGLAS